MCMYIQEQSREHSLLHTLCCHMYMFVYKYIRIQICFDTCMCVYIQKQSQEHMGWLRLAGSLRLQVSFAECSLFYRALLQKRPIILRSLLTEATPYQYISVCIYICIQIYMCAYKYIYIQMLLTLLVYVCTHIYAYKYMLLYAYTNIYAYKYIVREYKYVCIQMYCVHTNIYAYTHICMYIQIYMHTNIWYVYTNRDVSRHICMHLYLYTNICMCILIYMHTDVSCICIQIHHKIYICKCIQIIQILQRV